ncbi:MAG: hypothetical protein AAGI48_16535 [Verrucomicrobiota bacterium]
MKTSNKEEKVVKLKTPVSKEITTRVGREILRQDFEPSLWARALATAKGDQDAIVAEYARLRITQLSQSKTTAKKKTDSLEERRLNACLGVKTVQDILNGVGRVSVEDIPRPKAPWIWMLLLVLGLAGCTSTAARLLMGEIPEALRLWMPIFSLSVGLGTVVVMVLCSQFFSRAFVTWAWGPGIVGLASIFCLGSLLLGTKLMMKNPYRPLAGEGSTQYEQQALPASAQATGWQDKGKAGVIRPVTESAGMAIAR